MLKKLNNDDYGFIVSTIVVVAIVILLGLGMMAVFAYFFVDMLVRNVLPICAGIALVIAVPIIAKGWYYKKTGTEYQTSKGSLLG